jgi:hypothetical protein
VTESDWLAGSGPQALVRALNSRAHARKLRLFACGCLRQVWDRIEDPNSRAGVERGERLAERQIPFTFSDETWAAYQRNHSKISLVAHGATYEVPIDSATCAIDQGLFDLGILHDVFGNPFRPVVWSDRRPPRSRRKPLEVRVVPAELREWNDGLVVKLARAIYEERAFERMPILGDALEDAGCTNAAILEHCRGGPHVLGCWLLDWILEKQ